MKIRIIKIRSCSQCGYVLSQKCPRCVKHPDRKPTIIAYYPLADKAEVCHCGHGVKVECQVPDNLRPTSCKKTVWKSIAQAKSGRIWSELFCSKECAAIMTGIRKRSQSLITCSNPECDRGAGGTRNKFKIHQCRLKNTAEHHYCCNSCRAIGAAIFRFGKEKIDDFSIQMLTCNGITHRNKITEHSQIKNNLYECTECGERRDAKINMREVFS